ncbi:hypothetical protein STTU_p0052 (plasmid) [Streptomyces sp. Tu6071]|nr:hypothetical protein STTU_p0052 [Streptomyces sp. Tu6071]
MQRPGTLLPATRGYSPAPPEAAHLVLSGQARRRLTVRVACVWGA